MNSDTIREYISPDQLLVCFGGEDTWEYDYDREVARYLEQIQQGWKEEEEEGEGEGEATEFRSIRSNEVSGQCVTMLRLCVMLFELSQVHSSDLEQSPTGGSQESGGGEVGAEEGRKVRLSPAGVHMCHWSTPPSSGEVLCQPPPHPPEPVWA